MSTLNISLPVALQSFVDKQVNFRSFGNGSDYLQELLRKDQDRLLLRELLLAGAATAPAAAANSKYFGALRGRVGKWAKAGRRK